MILIKPIFEKEASESIKKSYLAIKTSLNLPSLPLFFAYFGNFPEYLEYITKQLVDNLNNNQFNKLCLETKNNILNLIKTNLSFSEEINNWLSRYQNSPSFFNFQKNLQHIFLVNIKLVFIFIALREAIKGWAIAAKKLPPSFNQEKEINTSTMMVIDNKGLFFDNLVFDINQTITTKTNLTNQAKVINQKNIGLNTAQRYFLEKDLLSDYLILCQNEFLKILKTDSFWIMRVGMEKIFVVSLQLFPNLIFSPINITLKLIDKNPNCSDFLYLLCEHFPTYAMQRMIFSGYMLQ